jgi:N-acetylneuraminic acid mutarotase
MIKSFAQRAICIFVALVVFTFLASSTVSASTIDLSTPWGAAPNSAAGYSISGSPVNYSFPRFKAGGSDVDVYAGTNSYAGSCSSYETNGTCYQNDPDAYRTGFSMGPGDDLKIKSALLSVSREGHSCVENPKTGKMYCFGGNDGSGASNHVEEYNPATDINVKKVATLPTKRLGLSCAEGYDSANNLKIYCFGGYGGGSWLNQIIEYDPAAADTGTNIKTKTATLPSGRYYHSCARNPDTNKIYCFGGITSGGWLNQIIEYDPTAPDDNNAVKIKTAALPGNTAYLSCAEGYDESYSRKIYCFGGKNEAGSRLNQIIEYNPSSPDNANAVLSVNSLPSERMGLACNKNPQTNKIYCFGGSGNSGLLNEIVEYNPVNNTLATKASPLTSSRWNLSCTQSTANSKIYCFGGNDGSALLNQIFEYSSEGAKLDFHITLYNNNALDLSDTTWSSLYRVNSCPGQDIYNPALTEKELADCSAAAGYSNQSLVVESTHQTAIIPSLTSQTLTFPFTFSRQGYYQFNWHSQNYESTYPGSNVFASGFVRIADPTYNLASFVSYEGPSSIVSGANASVKITMKNIGKSSWSKNTNYHLGLTEDNVWGATQANLPESDTFVSKSALLPAPRYDLSCVENTSTGKIYCFGGSDSTNVLDQITEYDPVNDTLITKSSKLPTARDKLSCAQDSSTNKIYCFGGWTASGYSNQILEYTPSSDSLTIKSTTLPAGMWGLSCAENSATNKIYCFGGYATSLSNKIFEYDPLANSLNTKTAVFPSNIITQCAENSASHKIYCLGGTSTTGKVAQIYEYDPVFDTLATKSATLPFAAYLSSCKENSGSHKIYCYGGLNSSNTLLNQIVSYNSALDTLTTEPLTLPSGTDGLSCTENSTTNKIYCFGGYTDSATLNTISEHQFSTINPGQSFEFPISVTAPSLSGATDEIKAFNWQVHKSGVKFDNKAIISITVTAPDKASFVSYDGPTTMVSGATASVKITLKNSGTTKWTKSDGYYLGSQDPAGNIVWGLSKVDLLPPDTIKTMAATTPNVIGSGCAKDPTSDKIFCFGGITSGSMTNQIFAYDPISDDLTTLTTTLTEPQTALVCSESSLTNKIYCFGGNNSSYAFLNQIIEFDPSNNNLANVGTLPRGEIFSNCIESANDKIYCFQGFNGSVYNEVLVFDPSTHNIAPTGAVTPAGIYESGCANDSSTNKIYCFGGHDPSWNFTNQIFEYDPAGNTVNPKTATLPASLSNLACAENSAKHTIYCFGGYDGTNNVNQVFEYDPKQDLVFSKTAILPTSEIFAKCVNLPSADKIYCLEGYSNTEGAQNEIVEYVDGSVLPNQTYSFNFGITAPTLTDTNDKDYSFNWQMYGPKGWFDQKITLTIKVVPVTVTITGKVWIDSVVKNRLKDVGEPCYNGVITFSLNGDYSNFASDTDCLNTYSVTTKVLPPDNVSLSYILPTAYRSIGWYNVNDPTETGASIPYTSSVSTAGGTPITKEINFGLRSEMGWFQINGGDLYANYVRSPILPNTVMPYDIRDSACAKDPLSSNIYCFGGYREKEDGSKEAYDGIVEFNPNTLAVKTKNAKLPRAKYAATCTGYGADINKIYCFGGVQTSSTGTGWSVIEYDPRANDTSAEAVRNDGSLTSIFKSYASCVDARDASDNWKIYCFGEGANFDQIIEYDPHTLVPMSTDPNVYYTYKTSFSTKRLGLSCAPDRSTNVIYCFGGIDGTASHSTKITAYNPATNLATDLSATLTSGRHYLSCAADSSTNFIYCFGGTTQTGMTNEIFEYNPATNNRTVMTATTLVNMSGLSCTEGITGSTHSIFCFGGDSGGSAFTDWVQQYYPPPIDRMYDRTFKTPAVFNLDPDRSVVSGQTVDLGADESTKIKVTSYENASVLPPNVNYDYFYKLAGSPTTSNLDPTNPPTISGIYYYDATSLPDQTVTLRVPPETGSVTTWTVPNDTIVTVLIKGNLKIASNIEVPVGSKSSVEIIASGNIFLNGDVAKVEGFYFTDGEFRTGYDGSATQLLAAGSFSALGGFSLDRDLDTNNANTPAEQFSFRPDLLFHPSDSVKKSFYSWTENLP